MSTHPPLKAPTGFFTGATTVSCLSTALVWNPREAAMGARTPARAAALKNWVAIVSFAIFYVARIVSRNLVADCERVGGAWWW